MSKLPLSLLVASAAMLSLSCEAVAATSYGAAFYPNDPLFPYNRSDLPGFAGQWHLQNLAPTTVGDMPNNAKQDVNIVDIWARGVTGAGVVIGIIDNGVEGSHEDLAANYREDLSKNFSQNADIASRPQGPIQATDNHGTAVAGVAAAVGGNGIGVTGAAPAAQIAGQRISFGGTASDPAVTTQDLADAYLWQSGVNASGQYSGEAVISVKNNSYGVAVPFIDDSGNLYNKNSADYRALSAATANNVIFVFAAGNERGTIGEQAQAKFLNASELVVEVAALGSDGKYSVYSNFGSSVFVTAPSNSWSDTYQLFGITTTDRTGPNYGYNTYVAGDPATSLDDLPDPNYTSTFGGTSSASPLVSGIIALGKQVTPAMDVRLAKHALALTSRIVDENDQSAATAGRGWQTNAAGYNFNPNYGFGLIDATAFVQKVIDSAYVTDRTVVTASGNSSRIVQFGDDNGVTQTFTISEALATQPIETVETRISMTGPNTWKDLHIALTSPSGTISDLLLFNDYLRGASAETVAAHEAAYNEAIPGFDWVFTANNFWGENAAGEWSLQAWNRGTGNITWNSYSVTINLGAMVMESGNMVINTNVKAHSLNLDYATTYFKIESGNTFTVTDSVTVNAGTVDIYGTLNEGTPTTNTSFNKGSKLTIGSAGKVLVHDGATLVARRGVVIDGGSLSNQGALTITAGVEITNNGTFASTTDVSFSGALTINNGNFTINTGTAADPAGKLIANGGISLTNGSVVAPTQIDTGAITINNGTLKTGVLNAGGTIAFNGGVLDVTGNITTAELQINGGQYSPGGSNRIATTNIVGNVTIAEGGTFVVDVKNVEIDENTNTISADILHATGTVTLGGTFIVNRLTPPDVQAKPGDTLTFLTSDTAITGEFAVNAAAITPTLHYEVSISSDGKSAIGTATRDYNFEGIHLTPNQRAFGTMLNTLLQDVESGTNPDIDPTFDYDANIFDALDSIYSDNLLRATYDQLTPLNSVVLGQDLVQQMRAQSGAMKSRAREARSSFIQPGSLWTNPLFGDSYGFNYSTPLVASTGTGFLAFPGYDETTPMTLWMNGGGSYSSGKTSSVSTGYDSFGYNATLGLDYRFSDEFLIGVLVGYSGTQTDFDTNGMKNTNGSLLGGLYAAGHSKGWFYSGLVGYSFDNYSLKRSINVAPGSPLNGSYRGSPDGSTITGFAEVGYEWRSRNWSFGPTLSVQYLNSDIDAYTEDGTGWQRLTVDKQSIESLTTSLGWRVSRLYNFRSVSLLPEVRAAWIHEFKDNAYGITSVLNVPGANKFTIQSVEPTSDYGNLGFSLSMMLTEKISLTLDYDCYLFISDVDPTHQASATLRVSF